jgi:hypothetical protein
LANQTTTASTDGAIWFLNSNLLLPIPDQSREVLHFFVVPHAVYFYVLAAVLPG